MASPGVQSPTVERIIISLPKELLERLNRIAQRKGLSRASYIRMVLTEHVNKQDQGE
jgi:metal-responsive CopG/Arc/MetJ family transcriptional regulator